MENKEIAKEYVDKNYISKQKIIDKIKDFEWNKNKLSKEKSNIMKDAKIYSVIDILDAEIARFVELLEDK